MTPLGLVVSFSMGSVKPDPWVLVQDNIREDRPENPPLGLHRGPVWWMDFKAAPWPPISWESHFCGFPFPGSGGSPRKKQQDRLPS